jgi:hypothetical protein
MNVYFIVIATLGIIGLSNYYTNEIGEAYYEGEKRVNKVFDVVHHLTPDMHKYQFLVNVIPPILFLGLFCLPNSSDVLYEFLGKFLLIHLIRSLTIISTILPKHEMCVRESKSWLAKVAGDCYDKVFSGHTASTFLLSLLLLRENVLTFTQFVIINLLESTLILLTRAHYTIDVILAYFITYLVYDGDYHIFTNFFKKLKV